MNHHHWHFILQSGKYFNFVYSHQLVLATRTERVTFEVDCLLVSSIFYSSIPLLAWPTCTVRR